MKPHWLFSLLFFFFVISYLCLDKIFVPFGDEVFFTEPSLNEDLTTKLYPPHLKEISLMYGREWLLINRQIFKFWGYDLKKIRVQSLAFGTMAMGISCLTVKSLWPFVFYLLYFSLRGMYCGRPEMGIVFFIALSIYLITRGRYLMAGLAAGMCLFWHVPSGLAGICAISGLLLAYPQD